MSNNNISSGTHYDLFDNTMHGVATDLWSAAGIGITTSPGTIFTTNVGNPGQTLTWNGTNPIFTSPTTTTLKVNGDAEIDGDIKVKGKSLSEAIENIEKRLAILHPNEKLEEKWEQLKALGERYRELEKDILEKEKIWEIIKK